MHIQPKNTFEFHSSKRMNEGAPSSEGLLQRKFNALGNALSGAQPGHNSLNFLGGKRESGIFQQAHPYQDLTTNEPSSSYIDNRHFQIPGYAQKLSSFHFAQSNNHSSGSTRASDTLPLYPRGNNPFELSKDLIAGATNHLSYGTTISDPNQGLMRHHSNMIPSSLFEDRFSSNVFAQCSSIGEVQRRSSHISRRLFNDEDEQVMIPQRRLREDEFKISSRQDFVDTSSYNSESCDFQMPMQQQSEASDSFPEESTSQDDVDEFSGEEQPKQLPLDQILRMRGRNEFVYDPENGGGRRRRNKKVSRIELLNLDRPSAPPKIQIKTNPRPLLMPVMTTKSVATHVVPTEESDSPSTMMIRVEPSLYQADDSCRLLETIDEPRNPGKNSITPQTLATFLKSDSPRPHLIIDCRFDYEYEGGHIQNAINIQDPEGMQRLFFRNNETVERLMNTVIIFHCEFSQKRGPAMYSALRELDRRLHVHCYPQIFYPEIYILEGGYKQFFECQPSLCTGRYIPMSDKNFKSDCREKFTQHKRDYKDFEVNKRDAFNGKENEQPNIKYSEQYSSQEE